LRWRICLTLTIGLSAKATGRLCRRDNSCGDNTTRVSQKWFNRRKKDSHLKRTPAPIDLHWYEGQARKLDSKDPAERLEAARALVAKQHELQEAQRQAAERQLAASARIYQTLQKDGINRETAERVTRHVVARGEREREYGM
jgi:hypothetical protein